MKTIRVLVIEDDLETLSVIMSVLKDFENKLLKGDEKKDVAVTVFSEYTQVEGYLNNMEEPTFDVVLLDRDCKLGGSFHALNLDKFGKDKIIGISSVPEYNDQLAEKGINITINKDYLELDAFGAQLLKVLFRVSRR